MKTPMRTYLFVMLCINKLFNSIQFNGWIHMDTYGMNNVVFIEHTYEIYILLNVLFMNFYIIL